MDRANAVIVGGGVVGCAIAAELAARCTDVFLLEQLPRVGMATSTRNSGVIHSGLYYPPGTLKARHCVDGNRLTYEFCQAHGVAHKRTGKLIVATSTEEEQAAEELLARGRANGIDGLEMVSQDFLRHREPHVRGRRALFVPTSGLVESEELVRANARLASERGAHMVTHARVHGLEPERDFVRVLSSVGELETRVVVNSAGLFADEVAALAGNRSYRIYPCRGEYYEAVRPKSHLINFLVYPLPDPRGRSLGVHLTRTLHGTLLFGPNARYIDDKNDYEKDLEPAESFCERVRKLLPQVEPADLRPAYSGIRAKRVPAGEKETADFIIERDPRHPHVIHLVGIESPGLTAAPSIARQVATMVAETLS
jgi:glycerol-3-phosphate dehydrogenase